MNFNCSILIRSIIIIQTPFHKEIIKYNFKEEFYSSTTLIISEKGIINEEVPNLFEYSSYRIDGSRTFLSIKKILLFKNNFKKFESEFLDFLNKFCLSTEINIYAGTDREWVNQYLFYYFSNKNFLNIRTNLVDEGIGFYTKPKFIFKIFNYFIPSIVKLLIGFPIFFIKPLGNSKYANSIYLREPLKAQCSFKGKILKKINFVPDFNFSLPLGTKPNVLLFSFLNHVYSIPDETKISFLKDLEDLITQKKGKLFIKPHPREDFPNLYFTDSYIIPKDIAGEFLNLSSFDLIIHFNSSIALSIDNSESKVEDINPIDLLNISRNNIIHKIRICVEES